MYWKHCVMWVGGWRSCETLWYLSSEYEEWDATCDKRCGRNPPALSPSRCLSKCVESICKACGCTAEGENKWVASTAHWTDPRRFGKKKNKLADPPPVCWLCRISATWSSSSSDRCLVDASHYWHMDDAFDARGRSVVRWSCYSWMYQPQRARAHTHSGRGKQSAEGVYNVCFTFCFLSEVKENQRLA